MTHSYFAELHASPSSQLAGSGFVPPDSPAVSRAWEELRQAAGLDELSAPAARREALLKLAGALGFQLRYTEEISMLSALIDEAPDDAELIRRRAARELTTLRCEAALKDFARCAELGMNGPDTVYRDGLARYFSGDYEGAMKAEEQCFAASDEELGIGAIYWHTLAAWRLGAEPSLLKERYRPGMKVGHHFSYDRAMSLAAGYLSEGDMKALIAGEDDDLEYPMIAYGYARWLIKEGRKEEGGALLKEILKRDGFWIAYGFIGAWSDVNGNADGPRR
jgi:tetratricopeptide (TPR) repeat protein